MRLISVLVFTALVATGFAQSSGPAGTFWLGTSLMYETPWNGRDPYTFGFGIAPVVRDNGNDNDTRIGLAFEADFYQDRQPRGLALVARVGLVDGNLLEAAIALDLGLEGDGAAEGLGCSCRVPLLKSIQPDGDCQDCDDDGSANGIAGRDGDETGTKQNERKRFQQPAQDRVQRRLALALPIGIEAEPRQPFFCLARSQAMVAAAQRPEPVFRGMHPECSRFVL